MLAGNEDKNQINAMLQHSIESYASMYELLQDLAAVVSGNKNEVKRLSLKLVELRQSIALEDKQLLPMLKEAQQCAPEALKHNSLMQQRLNIMRKVKEMNDLLLPEISGIMTLISHEIRELRSGRNAISGYRPQGIVKKTKRHFTA